MTSNTKNRPNKQAKGFTKHYERRKAMGRNQLPKEDVNTLIVRGTLDELGRGRWMITKKIKIEHPVDKGYFKEVYVLHEKYGKTLLNHKKRMRLLFPQKSDL